MKEKFFTEQESAVIIKSLEELKSKAGGQIGKLDELTEKLCAGGITVNRLMFRIIPGNDQKQTVFDILTSFLKENKNILSHDERDVIFHELIRLNFKKDEVCKMIIEEINRNMNNDSPFCWSLCDELYNLRQKGFIDEYIKIAECKNLSIDRQMLFLLFGKLKDERCIPVIIENLNDETVNGHALSALGKYKTDKYNSLFVPFLNDSRKWVRKIAEKKLNGDSVSIGAGAVK